ncbi:MAG: LON peptidase substrate-binding domain-containing protein [Proteobacteria bacterium]|nr:LON peptidase substrate-binding domain-containing protein [Pseudomonadota bacterium]
MGHFRTRAEDLPQEFPVFPLTGALLLPRGRLPLNIFEPRYLAMTEDAMAAGRMFAMIQPDSTRPAGPTGPALFRIGCLGRLTSFSETEDGRYLITLTGLVRFTVTEELPMRRGYRRVRGDFAPFLSDLGDPPAEPDIGAPRPAILAALRSYFARKGIDANWDAIGKMADDALVTTLCMVCPFEPAEKQALLEAENDAARGATLLTLLEMAAAGDAGGPPGHTVS